MIIYRYYDRSDFFITFIYNSKWNEITSNIFTGSTAADCLDIISRVFNLKLKILMNNLFKKHILGKIITDIHVIEFQKRDRSYAHILLIMNHDDNIRDIEDIDDIIYAEIPDRSIDSNLYDIVTSNMMHDSCDSKCMINEKYSKKYS